MSIGASKSEVVYACESLLFRPRPLGHGDLIMSSDVIRKRIGYTELYLPSGSIEEREFSRLAF